MKEHKFDVLSVLTKSKEFVIELKGSKHPLKDLCLSQLEVPEDKFSKIFTLHENGVCYESDADSDGDLRCILSTIHSILI